jgi:hypothetical protein
LKVKLKVPPFPAMVPLFQRPLVSLVDVCTVASMLVQVTVVPWGTVRAAGEKARFWIVTAADVGVAVAVAVAVGVGAGEVAVGLAPACAVAVGAGLAAAKATRIGPRICGRQGATAAAATAPAPVIATDPATAARRSARRLGGVSG